MALDGDESFGFTIDIIDLTPDTTFPWRILLDLHRASFMRKCALLARNSCSITAGKGGAEQSENSTQTSLNSGTSWSDSLLTFQE